MNTQRRQITVKCHICEKDIEQSLDEAQAIETQFEKDWGQTTEDAGAVYVCPDCLDPKAE